MNYPMPSGSSSGRCCPRPCGAASGWTTEGSSTGSCGSSAPARPGGMCPSGTDPGPRCTPVSAGGPRTAPSSGCCGPRRPRRTRPGTSAGWCRSTPPSCGPTSTRPGPEKVPLWSSSSCGGGWGLVEGAVSEHCEEHVETDVQTQIDVDAALTGHVPAPVFAFFPASPAASACRHPRYEETACWGLWLGGPSWVRHEAPCDRVDVVGGVDAVVDGGVGSDTTVTRLDVG